MQTKISIQEPCSESWGSMQKAYEGRFCRQCQTTVVDFTGKSSAYIEAFFKNRGSDKICARFEKRHTAEASPWMNRLDALEQRFNKTKLRKMMLGMIAILLFFSNCGRKVHGCAAYGSTQSPGKSPSKQLQSPGKY